ncbi:two-component regulator propeller domain-containing protein [Flavisolibacter ginsenosidimutans]
MGHDRIDQIVEGSNNSLWIQAYDKEVYRFDKRTEEFLPLSKFISGKNGQRVAFTKILLVGDGLVWLQSVRDGIFCVNQNALSNGVFSCYKKGLSSDYNLPSERINFFHEDGARQIWIGTPEGLCCLVPSAKGEYKRCNLELNTTVKNNFSVFDEGKDQLYFGTAEGNLVVYDKKTKTFSERRISGGTINGLQRSKKTPLVYASTSVGEIVAFNPNDQSFIVTGYQSAEALHSIYEDNSGTLWIEPDKLGVIRFDPVKRTFQSFSQKVEDPYNSIGNRFKVFEDNSGKVWVNMRGGGFGYYNPVTAAMSFTVNTADLAAFRLPEIVYNIYYDQAGILWLRVNGRELVKIIFQGDNFQQQLLVDPEVSILDNEIRGIFSDNKARLWLGTRSGRFFVYQNGKKISGLFENEPQKGLGLVYSILQDSRGNVWIGTKGAGLFKATPLNKEETKYRLTHYEANKNNVNSLTGNEIYSLLEDRVGRIWIGTFDEGLFLVQSEGDSSRFVHSGDAFKDYPKNTFRKIRNMTTDGAGNIWIGTTDGLLIMSADENNSSAYRFATYSKIPGDVQSLGNNNVQYVFRDSKNRMWLATSGGGFDLAVGSSPFQSLKFETYTTKDGLPNDYALSCAEDKSGNLWIATENGLSKFNPEAKTFRNYDSYDGLPKVGFSESAACPRLSNGQLIFGTTKGYLAFDPERINGTRIAANIAFTHLQINNEDAGPGLNQTILTNGINYASELQLKYNQNIISIDYAILDHRAGNRQEFAYRLVGFDTLWHNDRQLRRATYTNLPPGHYVFEVKSLSTDLYSNHPYKRLSITILPPWWKTLWAYVLYAILVIVLAYFIWRYAVAMIRLRNKIVVEQKLAALKLNFFTNASHELRTPLTLIVNPLEQLARKEKLSSEGASYVDVARKNAARMVRFINQLLDLRKVQSDKATLRISRVEIVSFVKKVTDHFTEAARGKRIKLEVSAGQKELFAWVDAEKLDVVVYNLLGNAVKFTPEGKAIRINIQSDSEEQSFSISVCDEGPGVPKENLKDIFELFHEGENSNVREAKGTGIGLALSQEFVHLHGGKIWAENNTDGGLTVTVKLKSGSEHYRSNEVSFVDAPKAAPAHETPIEQQILPQGHYPTSPRDEQSPLVLLVEDNDELRSFIKGQLGEFYRVETAQDGEEGLQKALALLPDLIVSDIMMSKMDGIQMLDKLKNDVSTSHIPVVLLSAKYSIESQIEGLNYGADYYITKPFNSEFLFASINNLLRQRRKLFEGLVQKKQPVSLSPGPVLITSKDEAFLKDAIKVVEEGMADVDFNIETVAESMAMSRTTFYKKFKSLTNLAPVEFVRDMRLQRAKQLLEGGGANVSEVAYAVGFSSPKYFSTCFKEKYHVSPSDYGKSKAL